MLIRSVKLENIRSYLSETIEFPEGSTLLAGDIGSGKSTILLAIEFALFGIQRGEGDSLLRNGKHMGSVELQFEVDGKPYIIKRNLRRSAAISQETGYIIKDGIKKEASAVELKAEVLGLLSYPKELLTRKNLVFRYTVYTPQEAMKLILLDDKEFRIDTLRKVFGIDKYKRIRENAELLIKELRQQQRELSLMADGLGEKKKQKSELEKEMLACDEKAAAAEKDLLAAKQAYDQSYQVQLQSEAKLKEMMAMKTRLSGLEAEHKATAQQFKKNSLDIQQLDEEIKKLGQELGQLASHDAGKIKELIAAAETEANAFERKMFIGIKQLNESSIKKQHALDIKKKIKTLDKCMTCLQAVPEEHKSAIFSREDKIISEENENIERCQNEQRELENKMKQLKETLARLREAEKAASVQMLRFENLRLQKAKQDRMLQEQDSLKETVGNVYKQILALRSALEEQADFEAKHKDIVRRVDAAREQKHLLEMRLAGIAKEKQGLQRFIKDVQAEIRKKEACLERIQTLALHQQWLEQLFISLMAEIEKHVMAKLYHEFNELFQQWFKSLMEDETITVQLDDEFGPVITQNGYQVSVENLSGGEKTSCALAYRLSLNQVINDLIGTIKTKDLIILDEPTDGFSSEQLDRMRDILSQLNIRQIIIVSHEKKIESFVDHVISISKSDHVSHASCSVN